MRCSFACWLAMALAAFPIPARAYPGYPRILQDLGFTRDGKRVDPDKPPATAASQPGPTCWTCHMDGPPRSLAKGGKFKPLGSHLISKAKDAGITLTPTTEPKVISGLLKDTKAK